MYALGHVHFGALLVRGPKAVAVHVRFSKGDHQCLSV
jgi:hypothetical protein